MALTTGTRIGPYEIVAAIGAGGMGEVYRARDTRLDRIVAVKVLPASVAADPDFRQRFEREAKAISSLNHPHICTLYDVGREDAVDFLVMEHLEGETLAARLEGGALPFESALHIGIQIADALDTAHRQGIVHRDLKPGNIFLVGPKARKSGPLAPPVAKLLDFGLAKIAPSSAGVRDLTAAPTATSPLTQAGSVIGTFQYMAPEQIEGEEADARTDIFAFGAVLYEMLTGQRAFQGKTQASVIASILEREPAPLSTLLPTSPPILDQVIRTCLAKSPDSRWQSAGDVGRQLQWVLTGGPGTATGTAAGEPVQRSTRGWFVLVGASAAIAAGLTGTGTWIATRPEPPAPPAISRFIITPPDDVRLRMTAGQDVAISPDGRRVVYLGQKPDGEHALYLRHLDRLDSQLLAGTEQPEEFPAFHPIFSPDSAWVAFRLRNRGLMRIPVTGGPSIKVADWASTAGTTWGLDGTIVSSILGEDAGYGLYRVLTANGTHQRVTKPLEPGAWLISPSLLPGGGAVVAALASGESDSRIALIDLQTGDLRVLAESGSRPKYVPSGHLVFVRRGALMAVLFDAATRTSRGDAVSLNTDVSQQPSAEYDVSANGTLVYVPTGINTNRSVAPVWVDRNGRTVKPAVAAPLENPRDVRLSPDGRRLALVTGPLDSGQLWVHDLAGRPPIPLTRENSNRNPLWSRDGERLYFTSRVTGSGGLWSILVTNANGSSRDATMVPTGRGTSGSTLAARRPPLVWLPDGRLIFSVGFPNTGLFVVPAVGSDSPEQFLQTLDAEDSAAISPNDRWLAFRSTRTGRQEIWVMGVGAGAAPAVPISSGGGQEPVWSHDGRELFYLEGNKMMSVAVEPGAGPEFKFRPPTVLFDQPYFHTPMGDSASTERSYDVASDRRFLMIPMAEGAGASPAPHIVVVQNWMEELKRLVPTR